MDIGRNLYVLWILFCENYAGSSGYYFACNGGIDYVPALAVNACSAPIGDFCDIAEPIWFDRAVALEIMTDTIIQTIILVLPILGVMPSSMWCTKNRRMLKRLQEFSKMTLD